MKSQKYLKVVVTGAVEHSFVGTEDEVDKYLRHLKSQQMTGIQDGDAKFYKKDAPNWKISDGYSYYRPNIKREQFREKYAPSGLKISITSVEPPKQYF